ncbi:MAG: DMT family transporter [Hyphomicrobiaceae bacterium]
MDRIGDVDQQAESARSSPLVGPAPSDGGQGLATLLGFGAILLWSTLATLTALKGPTIPPFQTTAITFAIGGALLLAFAVIRGRWQALSPHPRAFALALYGLFAYHALYFAALRLAPAAEANLIASLWALLTVLMSGLLPGHRLRGRHVLAAVLGLAAAALLVRDSSAASGDFPARFLGLGLAFACAFVWASYSVMSRLVAAIPSESLALPCLATSALALAANLTFERWTPVPSATSWIALLLLGLGPVGAAFLLWDIGMKRGRIATLGVLAYASPIISTVLLVLLGLAQASIALGAACILMVAAAVIAVRGGN